APGSGGGTAAAWILHRWTEGADNEYRGSALTDKSCGYHVTRGLHRVLGQLHNRPARRLAEITCRAASVNRASNAASRPAAAISAADIGPASSGRMLSTRSPPAAMKRTARSPTGTDSAASAAPRSSDMTRPV